MHTIKMTYKFYRSVFCSTNFFLYCFTMLLMRNNDLAFAVQSEKAFCLSLFTIELATVCSY